MNELIRYFKVDLRTHIKRTETICTYLQSIEKLQTEIESKVHGLDELVSKITDIIDENRFLEIVDVKFHLKLILTSLFSLSFRCNDQL
jgi:hypothetical protein